MILDTSTAITGQSAKRARLSPALRISLLLHAAAAVLLATHPDAWPWGWPCWSESSRALFRGAVSARTAVGAEPGAPARSRGASPRISLTFDDGPDPEVTPGAGAARSLQAKRAFSASGKRPPPTPSW